MEWEVVKNALNQATSDFRALLSTGEVLSLEPKDVIMLIEIAEKSQRQLTEKDATIERLEEQSKKWEKAFDNADRQYLKKEKEAAELRRMIDRRDERLSKMIEECSGLRKALEEAKRNIQRIGLYAESPYLVINTGEDAIKEIDATLGEGDKE
ncbi:hypothetical protein [Paenibacillus aceti]|uniref:Uncharacterized protein n=1 Tax=Paenibacillus aceti TaxID=1820010 RepID=A0ABQ1VPX5_9BACL|nr:hypothetical protein [Paenibacillus aceti]GGF86659.1 hypothetical protein GCM10010913_05210 [Paenibacillus aceti]